MSRHGHPWLVVLAGQMVDIIPGFLCITRKTSLVRSLRIVYGDACAFTIVPQTFKLPEELDDWAGGGPGHVKWLHKLVLAVIRLMCSGESQVEAKLSYSTLFSGHARIRANGLSP